MDNNILWQVAQKAVKSAIRACEETHETTPPGTMDLLRESAETLAEFMPNKPRLIGQVLGEHLAQAAKLNKFDAVACLSKLGANVDWHDDANANGKTPLQEAVEDGRLNMIRALVTAGADTEARFGGETVVHRAISRQQPESLRLLLALDADPDALDTKNLETPLHRAASREYPKVAPKADREPYQAMTVSLIDALIEGGAEALVRTRDGHLPIHLAIHHSGSEEACLLLLRGTSYDEGTLNGILLMAIRRNLCAVISEVVALGANVLHKHQGQSLLDLTKESAQPQTLELVHSLMTHATVQRALPSADGVEPNAPRAKSSLSPM